MRSFSYWSVPHMHKGAWIMLPLLINKWNFTEGRTRHKVLLSHCVTPRWLKSGTDAMAHRKWGYAKKYLSNIKYLCLNPKRKACVMCCCFHCCSSLAAPSHLRKGKEPLALSPPSPKHPLPAAASKGRRKMKSWAAPVGLTINCSPHREMHLAIVITWPGGSCAFFFPSRKCLLLSYHPLCQGVHPCSKILAKVASPPHLPVRRGSNEARFVCHVRSSMHVVMEVIPINFYPEVCIVNLSSNKIRTST